MSAAENKIRLALHNSLSERVAASIAGEVPARATCALLDVLAVQIAQAALFDDEAIADLRALMIHTLDEFIAVYVAAVRSLQ